MSYPNIGYALSLGKLRTDSSLGEPLRLMIEMHSVTAAEAETLDVSLASRSDFSRAGVGYPDIAPLLRFELSQDSSSNYTIIITTNDPVQDTFIHLLISAFWSGGKSVKEYTALLDPPLYSGNAAADVTIATLSDSSDVGLASDLGDTEIVSDTVSDTVESSGQEPGGEIVVKVGDTLSEIVNDLDKPAGVDHYQALVAVYRKNPGAFLNNNMNLLRKGARLKIPSFEDMQAVTRRESLASFSEQLSRFNDYRVAIGQKQEVESTEVLDELIDQLVAEPESTGAEDGGIPAISSEPAKDAGEDLTALPAQQAEPVDPTLTIGQQDEAGEGAISSDADTGSEISALRQQLALLDESLLANGVESDSVRANLKQIQDQVERMSTLIQVEDKDLAMAQNRAAQQELEVEEPEVEELSVQVEEQVEQILADATQDIAAVEQTDGQSVDEQAQNSLAVNPEASVEQEVDEEVAQLQTESIQSEEVVEPVAPEAMSEQPVNALEPEAEDSQTAQVVQAVGSDAAGTSQTGVDSADSGQVRSEPQDTVGSVVRKVSESSLFDSVKDIFSVLPEYGLKIAAGLLALIAGLFFWQRRKSRKEFDASMLDIETEEVSMNSEASIQRMNAATGIDLASANDSALELTIGGGMSYLSEEGIAGVNEEDNEVIKAGAVDPLAEADVYLAYDRDEQAIQVLKEAFADNPERGELAEKLLEIYHKQDDRRSFDAVATELHKRRDTTHNFSWEKIVGMGREVSPDNTLYTTGPEPIEEPTALDLDDIKGPSLDLDVSELDLADTTVVAGLGSLEIDDLDLDLEKELEKDKPTTALDAPTLSQMINDSIDAKADASEEEEDNQEISLDRSDLEFDLGQDDDQFKMLEEESRRAIEQATSAARAEVSTPEIADTEPSAIDNDSSMSEMSESSISKLEPYHESETALELAKAYLELGEQDIAKGFIEEVLNEGSEKQKGKARKLIRELAT